MVTSGETTLRTYDMVLILILERAIDSWHTIFQIGYLISFKNRAVLFRSYT